MKTDTKQDAVLKMFLRHNDPAGTIDAADSMRLEALITARVFRTQQQTSYAGTAEFFTIPPLLRGAFSWPVTITGTAVLGLALGLFVASLSDLTSTASYNIAMNGPWQYLMQ